MEYEEFLEKLKEFRIKKNLSQGDVARAMRKSVSYVSFIESNRSPMKIDDYLLFCKVLGISPALLFEENPLNKELRDAQNQLSALSVRDFGIIKNLLRWMNSNISK